MRLWWALAAVCAVGTVRPVEAGPRLNVEALAEWAIVVAGDAIPSERYAAEEFQSLFRAATGHQLPLFRAPAGPAGSIFIGHSQAMAGSSAGFGVDDLGDEDLRIRICEDNIAIAGGRPRGTLYGVYEFFERYLGARFLTHNHTHIPALRPELSLPCEEHTYRPPFSYRYSYYSANQAHPEFGARLRNNTVTSQSRLGGISRQRHINHSYYRQLPVEKYGAEHPEYFALVDGERRLDVGGGGPEPCCTNPEVVRIISESVLAELRAHPDWRNISVSQNDNEMFCRLHYGQAADTILAYLTFIHDNIELRGLEPGCFGNARDMGITSEVARKALAYFDKAMAAAENAVVRARVEKASICAYLAMIEAGGRLEVVDDRLVRTYPPEYAHVADTYAELCARYGVTMASELEPIGTYLARLRQQLAGSPAVTLENEVWRLVILPEANARIVAMTHKPSGCNLLRGMDGDVAQLGTIEELAERGFSTDSACFEAVVEGDSVILTRTLGNGSTLERRIALLADGSGGIGFGTTLTHGGSQATEYEIKVHPELNTGTRSSDSDVVAAYLRDGDTWKQVNRDWEIDHGPDGNLLRTATGGGFAYYQHEAGFGVRALYDPAQFDRPRLWWNSQLEQLNLELLTPVTTLRHGESLSYRYTLEFLTAPPR